MTDSYLNLVLALAGFAWVVFDENGYSPDTTLLMPLTYRFSIVSIVVATCGVAHHSVTIC